MKLKKSISRILQSLYKVSQSEKRYGPSKTRDLEKHKTQPNTRDVKQTN